MESRNLASGAGRSYPHAPRHRFLNRTGHQERRSTVYTDQAGIDPGFKGWYIQLDSSTTAIAYDNTGAQSYQAERVITDPLATTAGVVFFTTLRPYNAECADRGPYLPLGYPIRYGRDSIRICAPGESLDAGVHRKRGTAGPWDRVLEIRFRGRRIASPRGAEKLRHGGGSAHGTRVVPACPATTGQTDPPHEGEVGRAVRPQGDNESRRGFTLVEIMIAIAILGILVVLAVGNFGGMNEKYKVEAETKQFYADIMDARGRAMQRNRWSFVRITTNGYMTYEDRPLPDGDGAFDNTVDALVTSVTVRHAISTALAGGDPNFEFNRNGIANDNGTIRFVSTAQPDYDCITINPTRIKMGQYNAGTGMCDEK